MPGKTRTRSAMGSCLRSAGFAPNETALSAFYDFLFRREYIQANPMAKLQRPAKPHASAYDYWKPISKEQLSAPRSRGATDTPARPAPASLEALGAPTRPTPGTPPRRLTRHEASARRMRLRDGGLLMYDRNCAPEAVRPCGGNLTDFALSLIHI